MRRTQIGAEPSAQKSPAARKPSGLDALKLLRQDHETVSALFDRYEKLVKRGTDAQKNDIAREVCNELSIHARIEEEIFYPALRNQGAEIDALLNEADVEHASIKDLVTQLQKSEAHDETFDAKMKVLSEYVKHHVKEEQAEIFPAARDSNLDLRVLGAELAARKAELKL